MQESNGEELVVDTICNNLTEDEKSVLAQALTDFGGGIAESDIDREHKDWVETQISSIEKKLEL
jgi:hypothetical protein